MSKSIDYPASSLTKIKNKWYVSVTVPKALEHLFKTKQIKLSTGTSDKPLAKKIQHSKTSEIYARFDKAIAVEQRDANQQAHNLMQTLWEVVCNSVGNDTSNFSLFLRANPVQAVSVIDRIAEELSFGGGLGGIPDKYNHAIPAANQYHTSEMRLITDQYRLPEDRLSFVLGNTDAYDKTSDDVPSISNNIPAYIKGRNWGREKTKKEFEQKLHRFLDVVGDMPLQELRKHDAYRFAEAPAKEGKANKTITTYLTAAKGFLDWCEQNDLINQNPFVNLKLANYGKKSKHFLPFSHDELGELFSLNC